jgi:hypothetical protein
MIGARRILWEAETERLLYASFSGKRQAASRGSEMNADLVSIAGVSFVNVNNEFYVSSREVAEKFGKNHKDILRVFSNVETSLGSVECEQFTERNFAPSEYVDSTGRTLPEILMTAA